MEKETRNPALGRKRICGLVENRRPILPLPRGEGERDVRVSKGRAFKEWFMKCLQNTPHLDPLPSSDEGRGNAIGSVRRSSACGSERGRIFLPPSEGERIKVRG